MFAPDIAKMYKLTTCQKCLDVCYQYQSKRRDGEREKKKTKTKKRRIEKC